MFFAGPSSAYQARGARPRYLHRGVAAPAPRTRPRQADAFSDPAHHKSEQQPKGAAGLTLRRALGSAGAALLHGGHHDP